MTMTTIRRTLLLTLLLAVAVPATASAATVAREADGTLVYTAASGEEPRRRPGF